MKRTVFWHRRDLRITDNAGLYKALKTGEVFPVFVFDTNILEELPADDQRVLFIYREVEKLKEEYRSHGSDLTILFGKPLEVIPAYCKKIEAGMLVTNRDYEPYALTRDKEMHSILSGSGIEFHGAKEHVIFEKNEVLKADGKPYTVFTPYKNKWKETLKDFYLKPYPTEKYLFQLHKTSSASPMPSLKSIGFKDSQTEDFPSSRIMTRIIESYDKTRDTPSVRGTTRLGLHLRFGTISIRKLAKIASETNDTFLNELIWRDFYQMIIYHFPHSATNSFKKEYDQLKWEKNEAHFNAWKEGKTGYPLVDAGMRELSQTGFMHNRVRMVTASFLTKHLLIDWRLGEAWFAEKLLDYDLASNVGGWQWAAGSGCDAAPYFRVFNPTAQQEKFDKDFKYIKRWVPEFGTDDYPEPVIDHKLARERVLERYKEALKR